ncbi:MAG: sugar ABC transporter ATP-binding protein [Spirochaetia bacterium]|nr:sugar ABC transporter ATP-binding protein [Spirochaetia bacterium]
MNDEYILDMKKITKTFPGVKALSDVSFACRYGEIHALLGENGAGKSTLIKVLSAAFQPDSGEIYFKGKLFAHQNPISAQQAGIGVIYQEFNLVPYLSIAENIFLGNEPVTKAGLVDRKKMDSAAEEILKGLGLNLNVRTSAHKLSVAEQQMIEIAKTLSLNAELIVMDEPTATLSDHEIEFLFSTILRLKQQGKTIIYISHRLEEIFRVCDRVSVLKDGKYIGSKDVSDIDKEILIHMMVGRTLSDYFPVNKAKRGDKVLEVKNLTRKGVFKNISFDVYEGEILGLSGLVGAGRTEVVRAVFGADPFDSGEILMYGKPLKIRKPINAIRNSIGFATEDRKQQGLVLGLSVKKNITLTVLEHIRKYFLLQMKKEKALVNYFIKTLKIAAKDQDVLVRTLSGGNQQKVVLAKWLAHDSKVLILDEPTRGIDVGAKTEIYNLMRELTKKGKAIVMISSELLEVIGISDRIIVMNQGRFTGELSAENATEEAVMKFAIGGVE